MKGLSRGRSSRRFCCRPCCAPAGAGAILGRRRSGTARLLHRVHPVSLRPRLDHHRPRLRLRQDRRRREHHPPPLHDGIQWDSALSGAAFHPNITGDWQYRKDHTPAGHKVFLAVTPLNFLRTGLPPTGPTPPTSPCRSRGTPTPLSHPNVRAAYLNYLPAHHRLLPARLLRRGHRGEPPEGQCPGSLARLRGAAPSRLHRAQGRLPEPARLRLLHRHGPCQRLDIGKPRGADGGACRRHRLQRLLRPLHPPPGERLHAEPQPRNRPPPSRSSEPSSPWAASPSPSARRATPRSPSRSTEGRRSPSALPRCRRSSSRTCSPRPTGWT